MHWMRPRGWRSLLVAGWSGVDADQFQGERWCMLRDEIREGGREGGREEEREGDKKEYMYIIVELYM